MTNVITLGRTFKCYLDSKVSFLPVYASSALLVLEGVLGPVPTNFNKTVT